MMHLKWPVDKNKYAITSKFGWRLKPKIGLHSGIDLATPCLTEVKVCYKGVIVFTGERGNYGNCVIIEHPTLGKVWSLYAHLGKIKVAVRDWIEGGIIALSDNTGFSTGPHLHFEVRVGGNWIVCAKDPMRYLL